MIAAGHDPYKDKTHNYYKGSVVGLAIAALTFCAILHGFSRRGGILINNAFAIFKIGLLITIVLLGFVHAGGKYLKSHIPSQMPLAADTTGLAINSTDVNTAANGNFKSSFSGIRTDFGSILESFLDALFAFSGFKQPFYVLSEIKNPRRVLPKTILLSVTFATVLFVLVNISYFCVVPKEEYIDSPGNDLDMASAFFHFLFDSSVDRGTASRLMSGLLAISILGNLIVITFTYARVKQEVAKEGILPFSLFFGSSYTTPWARLRHPLRQNEEGRPQIRINGVDIEDPLEQSPMGALGLHWFSSIFLIAITAHLEPSSQYTLLTGLYQYVIVCLLGFLISAGLLYLKLDSIFRGETGRNWARKEQFTPWLDPLPAIIFCSATGFLVFGAFVFPNSSSPFSEKYTGYPIWIIPAIGMSSPLWGIAWWLGILLLERQRRKRLEVHKAALLVLDDDENYLQKVEIVKHSWEEMVEVPVELRDL
jgi:amino acid transporter